MKKRLLAMLLAVALAAALLPGTVFASEPDLPEWSFLFAIIKNVDADCVDANGAATHASYTMTPEEVNIAKENAAYFSSYMNQVGVMSARVYTVELDVTITQLQESAYGPWLDPEHGYALLKDAGVRVDDFDHVFCCLSMDVTTTYSGLTGGPYENGTGHSCLHFFNKDYAQWLYPVYYANSREGVSVHEFLHFMEQLDKKWGETFALHDIIDKLYIRDEIEDYRACYTDVILNRVNGDAGFGTGVNPAVWQYPPRTVRTMRELTVPEGVTTIGDSAFRNLPNLEKVTIPAGVTRIGDRAFDNCGSLKYVTIPEGVASIGYAAFYGCGSLESVTVPASVTYMDEWVFGHCSGLKSAVIRNGLPGIGGAAFYDCESLESVVIPASVTSIGNFAFRGCTSLSDVYYGGSAGQWDSVSIGDVNSYLLAAGIHYKSSGPAGTSFSDVSGGEWYADAVAWASANGITGGTGNGAFSPNNTCTRAEIVTFLWRAYGEPKPATAGNPFTDVSPADWYYNAVLWAAEKGITGGTGDGSFNPGGICTRKEAVTFQWRAANRPAGDGGSFNDVKPGDWYYGAVAWASANGITGGTGGGAFSPDRTCSRAEIVTFLFRDPAILG